MKRKYGFLLCIWAICLCIKAQNKIPDEFCGHWQNPDVSSGNWNGPVIYPEMVNFFYQLYYVDEVNVPEKGKITISLHNNKGETKQLEIKQLTTDTISYTFTGWDPVEQSVRRTNQNDMEKAECRDLPPLLFNKWVSDDKGTIGCVFTSPDKLYYEERDWQIKEIRRDIKKNEFELLLKSDSLYKLVYIRKVTPGFLDLASELTNHPMLPCAKDPAIYRILGSWTDPETNEWKYGFFEDFAIYKNDFWEYEFIRSKKNKMEVALKKGDERLNLKVFLNAKTDTLCSIVEDKGKKYPYVKYSVLPDYKYADHSKFKDTGYQPDSVTIIGYFRALTDYSPFEIALPNMLTDDDESFYADIDSLGRFRITFPILNATEAYIDWDRATIHTILEGGETFVLYNDFRKDKVLFMGENARVKQELSNFWNSPEIKSFRKLYLPYDAEMAHDEYFRKRKDIFNQQMDIFTKYIEKHPILSDKFLLFKKMAFIYSEGRDMLQRRFSLKRDEKEQFSTAYMGHVAKIFSQLTQPYTLWRDVSTFCRDYAGYLQNLKEGRVSMLLPEVEGIKELERMGRLSLTPRQKAGLKALDESATLSLQLQFQRKDSATIAQRLEPYKALIEQIQPVLEDSLVVKYLRDEWPAVSEEVMEINNINREVAYLDSVPMKGVLKDLEVGRIYFEILYYIKKPLHARSIQLLDQLVESPSIKNILIERQKYYERLDKENIDYVESLKKTDHLTESKDADALLAQLIEPYRGKVIYLDVWGTWCGPCKEELLFVGPVKESMKDKEVVFMYLANNSPEKTWKNVIKENHLTGPNVVHYNLPDQQQAMLERRLSINSFPTFILIDKSGKIVDMHAPRPRQKESLIKALNQLLDEK